MTRGEGGHRARWILAGLGVLLVAALIVAAGLERTPPAVSSPGTWTEPPAVTTQAPTGATPSAPAAPRYVFPVAGTSSYARDHHDYPASDLIAACGLAFRAPTAGVVLELSRVDHWDAATDDGGERGGLFVSMLGDDGVRYYGSHLRSVRAAISPGTRVKAGDTLAEVGNTGDASVCHLHFGISPPCAEKGDWWIRRGAVWPWSFLDAWRKNLPTSPAAQVTAWQKTHGCPGAP